MCRSHKITNRRPPIQPTTVNPPPRVIYHRVVVRVIKHKNLGPENACEGSKAPPPNFTPYEN